MAKIRSSESKECMRSNKARGKVEHKLWQRSSKDYSDGGETPRIIR